MKETSDAFLRLVQIMDELREGCPWDRKQTIHSLRQLTLEETYELASAITDEDWAGIREELGDLMLHLLFYSKIGTEQNQFTLAEVLHGIADKLVARHPHIYGDVKVEDDADVKRNWEALKKKEGKTSILSGLPEGLPALLKAMRLQEKAKGVGFEWEDREQVWDKVAEEQEELKEAVEGGDPKEVEEEFGDLLFSLVNYARFILVDAEAALERTNKKFIRRFRAMEALAASEGKDLTDLDLEAMDGYWNRVKEEEE